MSTSDDASRPGTTPEPDNAIPRAPWPRAAKLAVIATLTAIVAAAGVGAWAGVSRHPHNERPQAAIQGWIGVHLALLSVHPNEGPWNEERAREVCRSYGLDNVDSLPQIVATASDGRVLGSVAYNQERTEIQKGTTETALQADFWCSVLWAFNSKTVEPPPYTLTLQPAANGREQTYVVNDAQQQVEYPFVALCHTPPSLDEFWTCA
jgi:hypothetical protein